MLLRVLVFAILATASMMIVGCGSKNPMDLEVKAASADEFSAFRERVSSQLTADQRTWFDTAVQELKMKAIDEGVKGIEGREQSVRAAMNGKSVRETIVLGWKARIARLEGELKDMEQKYAHDSQLKPSPDNAQAVRQVAIATQNEIDIMARLKQNIADSETVLKALGGDGEKVK